MLEVKNEMVSTGDTEMSVHIRSSKTPELPKFQFSGGGWGFGPLDLDYTTSFVKVETRSDAKPT